MRIEEMVGAIARLLVDSVNQNVGAEERSQQPRPDCALMIGAVAALVIAVVVAAVIRIARRERSEAVGREQFPFRLLRPRAALVRRTAVDAAG